MEWITIPGTTINSVNSVLSDWEACSASGLQGRVSSPSSVIVDHYPSPYQIDKSEQRPSGGIMELSSSRCEHLHPFVIVLSRWPSPLHLSQNDDNSNRAGHIRQYIRSPGSPQNTLILNLRMTSSTLFLFFSAFSVLSSVSASGHLRLELTSSNDCLLRLTTTVSSQSVHLRSGDERTVSYHPRSGEQLLKVSFSIGERTHEHTYQLKVTGESERRVHVFSETALLIQSNFFCDKGFYGQLCDSSTNTTTSTSTTTSTTTTTTSTTTTTTVSSTEAPTTPVASTASVSNDSILIISLVILILSLLLLIVIVTILLLPRHQRIYIAPTMTTPEPKRKKEMSLDDSGPYECASPQSDRYTASPRTSTFNV